MKHIAAVMAFATLGAGAAATGSPIRVLHEFRGAERVPAGPLTSDGRGNLYGATRYGGPADVGTLFTIRPDGTGYRTLHGFAGGPDDGAEPQGALVADGAGRLYGVTARGGAHDLGTIFRIREDGGDFEVVLPLSSMGSPFSLTLADDGFLYGTTRNGLFRVGKDGAGFTVLHSFVGGPDDGRDPCGGLVVANGVILGTTFAGGQAVVSYPHVGYYFDGTGTIFMLRTDGTGFRLVHWFFGLSPAGGLASDESGALYGLTSGDAFQIDRDGGGFRVLSDLPASMGTPRGALIVTRRELLGETTEGLFRMKTDGTSAVLLHRWLAEPGESHSAGLSLSDDGTTLFRATEDGGAAHAGALSRIGIDGGGFAVIHAFPGYANEGRWPTGITAAPGTLYGGAEGGGPADMGLVYRMGRDGSGFAVLHGFVGGRGDGARPRGPIVVDALGRLYGATSNGGWEDAGVLFRCRSDGSDFRVLHSFARVPYGGGPRPSTLVESSGRLYGVTEGGGTNGASTVFTIDADGNDYRVLKEFSFDPVSGTPGYVAALAVDAAGNLYGVSVGDVGGLRGAIFTMRADGTQFRTLYGFTYGGYDAGGPRALVLAKPGVLVGATSYGGAFGNGALFRIGTDGAGYRVLHSLSLEETGTQLSALVTRDGAVWGETSDGGAFGEGTLFEFSTDGPLRVVRRFGRGSPDGERPGTILAAADGELYGTVWGSGLVGDADAIFALSDGLPRAVTGAGPGTVRRR
ncbi:MAG: choice-of-anchor tandem repeat GloVer-containing protein [Acidobacteriota bacterium]